MREEGDELVFETTGRRLRRSSMRGGLTRAWTTDGKSAPISGEDVMVLDSSHCGCIFGDALGPLALSENFEAMTFHGGPPTFAHHASVKAAMLFDAAKRYQPPGEPPPYEKIAHPQRVTDGTIYICSDFAPRVVQRESLERHLHSCPPSPL